jgi:hypothetical protein
MLRKSTPTAAESSKEIAPKQVIAGVLPFRAVDRAGPGFTGILAGALTVGTL